MWIPRTLWVGKVGLKVSLKQPSSAIGLSPFGSMGPGAGQVKIQTNYQVGLSILRHGTKSTPTTCLPNKTPTTSKTLVKSSLFRPMTKRFIPWHHHPPQHHPLAPARCHSLPMAPPLRVPRVGLPAPALSPAPMSPACPPPSSRCLQAGYLTPAPYWTPDPARARSTILPHPTSTAASVVTAACAA